MSHYGQHANCRACKTNPRSKGSNPRAAFDQGVNRGIPESSQTAREIEMAENEARLAELEPWTPLDPETRQQAKERIAAMKRELATKETQQ